MMEELQANRGPRLKFGVAGGGALGKHHARIYAELASAGLIDFAGIFDVDAARSGALAQQHSTRAFSSFAEATSTCDALSIVTPTHTHFDLAVQCIRAGKHVLVEKPMTDNAKSAHELVELAQQHGCILQVGHVERFNPVFKYLETVATEPKFIETHRLSPYPERSTDIGVVLDLMIHDLDVVLAFVKSSVTHVDAVGIPVLSASEDIANARLRFASGCVANLTVSRVSPERMRKIRVFSGGEVQSYISLDYRVQEGFIYRLASGEEKESSLLKKLLHAKDSKIVSQFAGRKIVREPVPIAKDEPLKLELDHFVKCVQARVTPMVSGESAMRSLDLALEITKQVRAASNNVTLRPI